MPKYPRQSNSRNRENLPLFVLGGGSNLVIADAGWPGLVLKIGITGINHRHGHDEVVFEAGAGEDWDKFVGIVVAHNCAGIECLSGIPGSVGGTPSAERRGVRTGGREHD